MQNRQDAAKLLDGRVRLPTLKIMEITSQAKEKPAQSPFCGGIQEAQIAEYQEQCAGKAPHGTPISRDKDKVVFRNEANEETSPAPGIPSQIETIRTLKTFYLPSPRKTGIAALMQRFQKPAPAKEATHEEIGMRVTSLVRDANGQIDPAHSFSADFRWDGRCTSFTRFDRTAENLTPVTANLKTDRKEMDGMASWTTHKYCDAQGKEVEIPFTTAAEMHAEMQKEQASGSRARMPSFGVVSLAGRLAPATTSGVKKNKQLGKA